MQRIFVCFILIPVFIQMHMVVMLNESQNWYTTQDFGLTKFILQLDDKHNTNCAKLHDSVCKTLCWCTGRMSNVIITNEMNVRDYAYVKSGVQ